MSNYYSQHGEDFVLDQLFRDKKEGFFVEVGCIDGRRFSNTLALEERGWRGLCVEAHAGYIELLRRNRHRSIICHCAAGEKDEDEIVFYANSRGSLSTVDRSKEALFRKKYGEYFTGFEKQRVPMRRLDTLFREHGITQIDIVSLDIEGYEGEALKGIDFQQYKPLVLVIESDAPEHESQLDRILIPNGYTKSVRIGPNIFYLLDPKLEERVKSKTSRVTLTHTRHPLDDGEDIQIKTLVDIRSKNSARHQIIAALTSLKEKIISPVNAISRCARQSRWTSKSAENSTSRFTLFEIGFHGDQYLLQLVDVIAHNCDYFIETGANVGSTLAYMARTYPHVKCLSCEPDSEAFQHSLNNTQGLVNVRIYNEISQRFLKRLTQQYSYLLEENVLFWLDAHSYGFTWPLKEEIELITTKFQAAYILIDDFRVPGLDCLGWYEYNGQECSFDHVREALNPKLKYRVYYPNYTERTSKHHPLRGWGLIEFGHGEDLVLPQNLQDKVRRAQ